MPAPIRLLILEDNPADAVLMVEELRQGGFDPSWQRVDTEAGYRAALDAGPSLILADYSLPQFDAPSALQILKERGLDVPFIVVSGAIGEETAVAIMRQGAADYLLKDRMGRLAPAVVAALETKRLREEKLRSEEAARRAEQKYREIFETAIEGISQSSPQGRIITANPALATMMGYGSPEELIAAIQDASQEMYVDPKRRADLVRLLEQNGSVSGFECQLFRKDRTRIWVSINSRVIRGKDGAVEFYNNTCQDITGLKAAEAALRQSQEELRDLAARLISAQETESRRLGRELHDGFSQKLAVLGIELGLLRLRPPSSEQLLKERLTYVCEQLKELAEDLHATSRTLHPTVLYDLGLSEALKHECGLFAGQHGIRTTATSGELPESIPEDVALCLYRITQESLWNIRNHAKASEARVALGSEGGEIVLTVEDNGCGFVRDDVRGRGGLGLVSMEERVRLVRGKFSIASIPQGGTRVEARVPSP